MAKTITKEVKVGIAFVVGMFLLFAGIKFLKGINVFKSSTSYVSKFDNVEGLTISTPVQINGYKVGMVSSINVNPDNYKEIIVGITLDKDITIPKHTQLLLDVSMLGTATMQLKLPETITKETLQPGDTLQGILSQGMMASIQQEMLPSMMKILPKIDSILTGLQAVANHPALTASLVQMEQTTANLSASTRHLQTLLANMNKDVPVITNNLITTTGNVSEITTKLNEMPIQEMFAHMDASMANIHRITEKLNQKDNSIGLLLNERALYDSLNIAVGQMSFLLEDLRKNPKKYINLKVF